MQQRPMEWKRFSGAVAWPTILLWAAAMLGLVTSVTLVATGRWPMWLGALVDTVVAYTLFTPMHEAAHGNIRGANPRVRGLESLVGWTSGFVLMAPFPAFKALHLRHHSNTNDPDRDPDMWVAGHRPAVVVARCMTIMPHYYWEFLAGGTARSRMGAKARGSTIAVMVGIAAGLIAGAWGLGIGSLLLWLWVGPAILASGLLAFAFDWLPHHPHAERARQGNTRLVGGPWLTVPMLAQNYHLVHHLYPRVPFYAYGRCLRTAARAGSVR